ncbi:MAG TPA: pyridoxal kinase PdxY [Roseococcus sp.]|nr:pyridoxal kinase PdxY [Roseococcus sp.]
MNILSIQSWVAYGHVGNASAMFPLQRLGAEVWAVNTVQFSNHTGYGAWRGQVFGAELVRDCVQGIGERGVLSTCDAVLSGYMGEAAIGEAILDAAAQVKAANPAALWCCDPVMGDVGRGIFVRPGIPEFLRSRAMPRADIATPNRCELEWLTGLAVASLADAKRAIAALQAMGPRCVLLTSLELGENEIGMVAADGDEAWLVTTPILPLSVNGAGDATAALFLFHWLRTRQAGEALAATTSAIFGILRRTAELGARELQVVAAQEELVRPSRSFAAIRI